MEVQVLQGQKTCFEGTDGDGYSLCGNGWGWVNFPLPCRFLVGTWTDVDTVLL